VAPTWVPTSTRQGKGKVFFEIHCREEHPTSVVGGVQSSTGTVTLSGPAPAGGARFTRASGNGAANVPASVTVPARKQHNLCGEHVCSYGINFCHDLGFV
jgi:hypothetical protein